MIGNDWGNIFLIGTLTISVVLTSLWLMKKKIICPIAPTFLIEKKKQKLKTPEELNKATWSCIGKVVSLWIYPIKSCAPIVVDSAFTSPQGLQHGVVKDRVLVLADNKGLMITARIVNKIVLIQPLWEDELLTLKYNNKESLTVKLKEVEEANDVRTVQVWSDQILGFYCGDEARDWLSDVLGRSCNLFYSGSLPPTRDAVDNPGEYPLLKSTDNSFYADVGGYMMMNVNSVNDLQTRVTNSISPQNFRPNILIDGPVAYDEDNWDYVKIGEAVFRNVKPCDRCIFTTIDYKTGLRDPDMEPLRKLRSYRRKDENSNPEFGINLGIDKAALIHIGDDVQILL